ncbi:MAG: oligopeptide/dipeptide ABC transporter ATP-binding protein [Methanosarcina thermophila]|jgi:peptide/nickel transport system ATP-binding protein|uniref:Nickel import system ATP-binding protein NikD n=3 Tax=Methanosarcina thermophila TaxID=2210 RepID=A0A1I7AWN4_METTE|nr:ABC transporter ATP-binding protein [Methanosarcina thermophila]ALK05008.1 MAG: peptide ABC transporter ATP-binding protein [Methanosarcina sp. 795]AKB13738.1 Dipeptide transport ATP-binding protein DppD [Methanosarcina thermophila TM-1]AKB15622.1 Dipeptide transport ATP-binding protein DppD [Methanosarcina thermophila CHTI-55]NLU57810.1 ABC transporter ATP-binding protein [Methanosarcina thermophila]SFT79343.1 Oligopeptide/dipeptide transporter, C-terminal region [Methanosarcina thermophil
MGNKVELRTKAEPVTAFKTVDGKKRKAEVLLNVEDLSLSFTQYTSGLRQTELKVISNLSIQAYRGEILAVVGSSGSGKSLLAHSILGILPSNAKLSGKIEYDGEELTQERKEALRGKEIALIPQATTYLDPLMKISDQVIGCVEKKDKGLMRKLLREIFQRYNLKSEVEGMLPHELSGGMIRRVLVSTAVIRSSKLIIADEPTPGLDEKTLNETLSYLKDMADRGCAVILITHDIEAALKVSHKIAVFYAGTVLEVANVEDFKNNGENLRHPYTRALWNALPQNNFQVIKGHQPMQDEVFDGCIFYERCSKKKALCSQGIPELRQVNGGVVRCNNVS